MQCLNLMMVLCVCVFMVAAQTPALPVIKVEAFEANIREQVSKAYASAQNQPRDAEANGKLGMVLYAYVQYDFALMCLARARHFAPEDFRWHYYFGATQSALGKHEEAAAAFKATLERKPDYLPAQLKLAESLLAAGQHRASQPLFEMLLKQKATAAAAHYGLGQIKNSLNERAAALDHFRQAVTLYPEYGFAHYALGQALRDLGQTAEAKHHLALSQQYRFQRPALDDPLLAAIAALNASATDLLARGVALAGQNKLPEAIAAHERAVEINPQLVQAHINLISLNARAGQMQQAEKHYRAAVAKNPNLADSHFNYGIVLMMAERYAEAAAAFKESLARNPFNADAHYNYGAIIERDSGRDGKLDEAATHFQQAIANNPEHRLSRFHWARLLVQQNKLDEAIAQLLQTIKVEDDETPRFTYALGATYARAGEKAKAIQYLRAARELALKRRQTDLAATIERDLAKME